MGTVIVPGTHNGPGGIGHGGYVVGLLAGQIDGPSQVTLRKWAPLDVELERVPVDDDGLVRWELRHGDSVIAEAIPATLELDIPAVPSLDVARDAEARSPSRWNERGVHPTCFGCAQFRADDIGLAIGVGPLHLDGVDMVASTWRPRAEHIGSDGCVDPHMVVSAIDCPGAMAFIAYDRGAGLLGRMTVQKFAPVPGDADFVVMAWQIGIEGRKHFAGSALATGNGTVLAASRQTWFPMERR